MKRICLIIAVLFLFTGLCFAGEKEELVWKVKYYQEKMSRMQVEYTITDAALKEATAELKALTDKEKAEAEAKKEKPKKGGNVK